MKRDAMGTQARAVLREPARQFPQPLAIDPEQFTARPFRPTGEGS